MRVTVEFSSLFFFFFFLMHLLLPTLFAIVASGVRLETTAVPLEEEVLDADSLKLLDAVRTVEDHCTLVRSGLVEEVNEAHRRARDFCG